MLIQADAFYLPYLSNYFHSVLFSPPYWGLRKYSGDQGLDPLGLEATPERHIERMVEVFREVWRVLRPDGVCWLNYADCFIDGQLALMPHRLAIALQADGWIVRNDLVWFKRNPMPESVAGWRWESKPCDCSKEEREKAIAIAMVEQGTERHRLKGLLGYNWPNDPNCPKCHGTGRVGEPVLRKSSWRHTRAHEYVFMLCKSMQYFCNQEVVREAGPTYTRKAGGYKGHENVDGSKPYLGKGGFADSDVTTTGRNPRSVLDVPTAPYKGAHYATFPPKLIAPLIRASVPRRCCPECGMAWAPVVEKDSAYQGDVGGFGEHDSKWKQEDEQSSGHRIQRNLNIMRAQGRDHDNPFPKSTVTDYRPTCECGIDEHEPGIVLDIFGGSGTTGMVAKQLLRRWVVMDISRPYLDEQAKVRTGTGTPANALDGLPMFEEGD